MLRPKYIYFQIVHIEDNIRTWCAAVIAVKTTSLVRAKKLQIIAQVCFRDRGDYYKKE